MTLDPLIVSNLHVVSAALAIISWTTIYFVFVRPAVAHDRDLHLKVLIAPHLFRYLGLITFFPVLFPVQSLGFSPEYLAQIGLGDAISGVLALIALIALAVRMPGAVLLVWIFNIVGMADFANAGLSMMGKLSADPSSVGPLGWVLLTLYLPMLTVSHFVIFWVLLSRDSASAKPA
ncbi:MAG TPA: hypothetical protein DCL48_04525 [Alphaproteobacteria bacterium]|nr:hypothetical protein [Alphaproteobacteria bacterium]